MHLCLGCFGMCFLLWKMRAAAGCAQGCDSLSMAECSTLTEWAIFGIIRYCYSQLTFTYWTIDFHIIQLFLGKPVILWSFIPTIHAGKLSRKQLVKLFWSWSAGLWSCPREITTLLKALLGQAKPDVCLNGFAIAPVFCISHMCNHCWGCVRMGAPSPCLRLFRRTWVCSRYTGRVLNPYPTGSLSWNAAACSVVSKSLLTLIYTSLYRYPG